MSLFSRWERSIIIKHTSSILKSLQSGREEQSRLLFSTASRRQINLVHLSSVVFSFCPPFYISLLISIPAWLASLFGLLTVGSVQSRDTFCYTCIYFYFQFQTKRLLFKGKQKWGITGKNKKLCFEQPLCL